MGHDLDTEPAPPVPSTWQELGAGMAALRGTLSYRDLEAMQVRGPGALVLTDSSLHRYESGATHPPLKYAEHLDGLYAANRWIALGIGSLWRAAWRPWSRAKAAPPAPFHVHSWPAGYSGWVWVKVVASRREIGMPHELRLSWGDWRFRAELALGTNGVLFKTGKARDSDGVAVSCHLESSRPVFALFGAGEVVTADALDIRSKWSRA